MSLSKVTFTKGQGGVGAPLPGEDFISGHAHYKNPTVTYRLTFSATLVASNSIALTITGSNGLNVTHNIVFTTDDATTLTAIATYLQGLLAGKFIAITTGVHYVQVTMNLNQSVTIGAVVTLGASQPTAAWATAAQITF